MISDFEKYLYAKLDAMQTEKAERLKNVEPNYVTKKEFFDAIEADKKAILNKWFKEGKIRVHKTIHAPIHDYVELVKEEKNE
jgi:hypothetical protein